MRRCGVARCACAVCLRGVRARCACAVCLRSVLARCACAVCLRGVLARCACAVGLRLAERTAPPNGRELDCICAVELFGAAPRGISRSLSLCSLNFTY